MIQKMLEIQRKIFSTAKRRGQWKITSLPHHLLKIYDEMMEAKQSLEECRDPAYSYEENDGKPCGFASELADVVITCFSIAEFCGINLFEMILRKMRYNDQRTD